MKTLGRSLLVIIVFGALAGRTEAGPFIAVQGQITGTISSVTGDFPGVVPSPKVGDPFFATYSYSQAPDQYGIGRFDNVTGFSPLLISGSVDASLYYESPDAFYLAVAAPSFTEILNYSAFGPSSFTLQDWVIVDGVYLMGSLTADIVSVPEPGTLLSALVAVVVGIGYSRRRLAKI